MRRPRKLPAFSADQYRQTHALLATRIAFMMGRKLEEGDWTYVYCTAKGIPIAGWSNLNIDIAHEGLGIEQQMLGRPSDRPLRDSCGMRLMHPSATRSIRIPEGEVDADRAMGAVLSQYAELIQQRRKKVEDTWPSIEPDVRTGWLLWQPSLREFLYFEEEMLPPDPDDYVARWKDSGGGSRKASRNLWVYEKETGQKRFSITTAAGAKIQPYFDVPAPSDPNLYYFQVQGEEIGDGLVRIWVTTPTADRLRRVIGDLTVDNVSLVIADAAEAAGEGEFPPIAQRETAVPIVVTVEAYGLLTASFPGVSDEHMMQLLVSRLHA